DTGFEQVIARGLGVIRGRLAVDDPAFLLADRTGLVHRTAEHVPDAAQGFLADRHLDAVAGVVGDQTALESVGRTQRNRAHHAVAELLLHLEGDRHAIDGQCVIDLRHGIAREFDVDDRADDLYDFALVHWVGLHGAVQYCSNRDSKFWIRDSPSAEAFRFDESPIPNAESPLFRPPPRRRRSPRFPG